MIHKEGVRQIGEGCDCRHRGTTSPTTSEGSPDDGQVVEPAEEVVRGAAFRLGQVMKRRDCDQRCSHSDDGSIAGPDLGSEAHQFAHSRQKLSENIPQNSQYSTPVGFISFRGSDRARPLKSRIPDSTRRVLPVPRAAGVEEFRTRDVVWLALQNTVLSEEICGDQCLWILRANLRAHFSAFSGFPFASNFRTISSWQPRQAKAAVRLLRARLPSWLNMVA